MRLKQGIIFQEVVGERLAVAGGEAAKAFNGFFALNETSEEILRMLDHDTTEADIVDAMVSRYDAPRDEIAADVREILDELRRHGVLEE